MNCVFLCDKHNDSILVIVMNDYFTANGSLMICMQKVIIGKTPVFSNVQTYTTWV